MVASKPVHPADAWATIIPFRPRRSQIGQHPSLPPPEPLPSAASDDQRARPHLVPRQLSLFEESTAT
jgi:hypothetical protein